MSLFDELERSCVGPRLYAEPEFTYLNRSGRCGVQKIREVLDDWYSHYPEEHRADLRGRFRSTDDANYRSAFFELFLHELLQRLGCQVQIHPVLAGNVRHPDFLLESARHGRFYLEAVLATDESDEEMAAKARMNIVYDALNRLESPHFFIGMDVIGAPATPPSSREIREFLARQLAPLNAEEIAEACERGGFRALPHWRYEHDGWVISLFPIPKSPEQRKTAGVRPIAIQFEEFRFLEIQESIRNAVLQKANRYGQLDLPFVIAVNVLADLVDRDDVLSALFGDEQIIYRRDLAVPQGPELGRAPNGAWTSPAGPRYTRVSGVLVAAHLTPSSIPWASVCLYHNPWAARPYDCELNRLHRAVPVNQTTLQFYDGESLASVFGLPADWPGQ